MANRWGIPEEVERAVLDRDKVCVYCAKPFSHENRSSKPSWEHIINDIKIATKENIALCCVGCNASKGAKLLHIWLESDRAKKRGVGRHTLAQVILDAIDRN